ESVPAEGPPGELGSTAASSPRRSFPGRRWNLLVVAGLAVLGLAGLVSWERARSRPGPSIAVLPLENLSGRPEEIYLADGLTDALPPERARSPGVGFPPGPSVPQSGNKPKPVAEIARELGVETLVEGWVVRQGDRVRVTAQLIDARRDRHLWAESYDRDV